MSKQTEALKLALEALEFNCLMSEDGEDLTPVKIKKAIDASREALASKSEVQHQEPVAWQILNGVCHAGIRSTEDMAKEAAAGMQKTHDLGGSLAAFHVRPLYAAPQLAQQDQGQSCYCPNCEALSKELAALKAQQQEPYVHVISGRTADELWLETGRLRSELADLKAQPQEPVAVYVGETWCGSVVRLYEDLPLETPLYASPPASKPWVGLTDAEFQWIYDNGRTPAGMIEMAEAKLREKNA